MHATGPLARAALAMSALALAGCGGGLGGIDLGGSAAPPAAAPAPAMTAPPVSMAGRWLLSSPGRGQCHMNFGAGAAAAEGAIAGTIAPEGGCPGKFFTSRKWAFESNQLIIRDHTGQPLAQLAFGASGRFDGQATNGQPVMLGR